METCGDRSVGVGQRRGKFEAKTCQIARNDQFERMKVPIKGDLLGLEVCEGHSTGAAEQNDVMMRSRGPGVIVSRDSTLSA